MVLPESPATLSLFPNVIALPRQKCSLPLLFLALLASACLISCAGATGGAPAPAPQPSVNVAPPTLTLATNQSFQFNLGVQNAPSAAVNWRVNNIPGGNPDWGTVSDTGSYVAPSVVPAPDTVTVTAVLQTNASISSSAKVTIVPPVTVSPSISSLTTSQTLQLQASGPNVTNANVTWSVNDVIGGDSSTGVITPDGVYTPPPAAGIYTIRATTNSVPVTSATALVAVTDFAGNLSWRNDNSLTGQNRRELALTPTTVSGGQFGKLFSCPVDGHVYAQPLYVANSNITTAAEPNTIHRNVVYVATAHNSVYAFDADARLCRQIWQTNFVENLGGALLGISTVPSSDAESTEIAPEIGITGTPVIAPGASPGAGTLYVVSATKENGNYVQRLHALDLRTGSEKPGSPVVIQANVPGTGDGSRNIGGVPSIPFDPLQENQRPALLLNGGKIYIAYGSFDNNEPFHGWLLAYDATTLARVAAFNTTPNGRGGGIGGTGAPPSGDASGNVFVATGNGTFPANPGPSNDEFGESVLRLATSPDLAVSKFFTPSNQAVMNSGQVDLGSSGVVLLPDQAGSAQHPRLAILGSQDGILYLLDRDNPGGYTPGGPDNVVQKLELPGPVSFYGTPAVWQGAALTTIYTAASNDFLKAFPMANGTLPIAPISQSSATFGMPGASPVISSSDSNNGIVWLLDTSGYGANGAAATPAVLHAYDASDLSRHLYNSSQVAADAAGPAVRLTVPTVANGKVYVGTRNELSVYGFLP